MQKEEKKAGEKGEGIGNQWTERAREVLIAQGKLCDFEVSDIPENELREKLENIAASKRIREATWCITNERGNGLTMENISGLIRKEGMEQTQ